ncbi:hypothetical protein BH10PSE19_BH10PSE19_00420 [soil metagenome]
MGSKFIDIEQAKLDPLSVFNTPNEVLHCKQLTKKQKIEILERWQYDALDLEVAEEENMAGSDKDLLPQVLYALNSLKTHRHPNHSHHHGTKHGA